jgi:hypothetical protein
MGFTGRALAVLFQFDGGPGSFFAVYYNCDLLNGSAPPESGFKREILPFSAKSQGRKIVNNPKTCLTNSAGYPIIAIESG